MSNNKQLYIGINGYAGSGKDTVAKMLKTILSNDWENLEQCKQFYKSIYTNPTRSATYNPSEIPEVDVHNKVLCIAYADQLKTICSTIFGIPIERFYMNKATAWVCINDRFQYTEVKPNESSIITAVKYYSGSYNNDSSTKYYMSLREILVYIGTYVLQESINNNIFVNIVRNKIKEEIQNNQNLKYVITTDIRFNHEIDFVRENNGITIKVVRDSVQQLDNVAEHELDNESSFDYIIENNSGYDELFEQVWDMVHNDIEFSNKTIDLYTRDESHINNYLRLIDESDEINTYILCTPYNIQNIYHNGNGDIVMINPTGGPIICIGEPIHGTNLVPKQIIMHEETCKFIVMIDNKFYNTIVNTY